MAKINNFDENKTYVPDIYALLHALANGHFHRKHNTVWSAFNEAQNALILSGQPILGKSLKAYFKAVAAMYPGTGTRGATDAGASNAGRHISALVKLGVFKEI
jgi:hypothetical protein